jgi:hypothetical protein
MTYLTPSVAPMTRPALTHWLNLRGVEQGSEWMANLLDQYTGKTEDEMDATYDAMHGSTA